MCVRFARRREASLRRQPYASVEDMGLCTWGLLCLDVPFRNEVPYCPASQALVFSQLDVNNKNKQNKNVFSGLCRCEVDCAGVSFDGVGVSLTVWVLI